MQVCSLSTITREYVALKSIGSLPFKDLIVTASEKKSDLEDLAWKISTPLEEYIKENLNKSQWDAIQVNYIILTCLVVISFSSLYMSCS